MPDPYLDAPLRSLREVRDAAEAEYRKLAETERTLTVTLWAAADNDRQLLKPRYDACRQRLDALGGRIDALDAEIACRERIRTPDGL